ncbi:hypothetical protein ACFSKS_10400 [Pseudocitrobacter faecalis]
MNKFEKAFQKLDPIIAALGRSPWLQTISVSMVSTIAITLIGSISVLLIVFPIDSVHQFFVATKMVPVFSGVATCTLGMLALYVTFLWHAIWSVIMTSKSTAPSAALPP